MTAAGAQAALQRLDGLHAAILSDLQQAVFPQSPWSVADCVSLISHPGTFGWLLLDNRAQPCAFLMARQTLNEVEILTFGVTADSRRSGYGSRLLTALLEDAGERNFNTIVLEVAASNDAAIRLYKKIGFVPVGTRPRYYRTENSAEDALLLQLHIEEEHL